MENTRNAEEYAGWKFNFWKTVTLAVLGCCDFQRSRTYRFAHPGYEPWFPEQLPCLCGYDTISVACSISLGPN